jgi:hypothetical protein
MSGDAKVMNRKLFLGTIVALLIFSVLVVPQIVSCQTEETLEPSATPTATATEAGGIDPLLIGVIVAVVVVVAALAGFFVVKRKSVNEKSLRKASNRAFEEWVIKKFNGKPSDPATGVNAFTQGGQPLLIVQSDNVGLAEVKDFVKVLARGKAAKGAVVAFNYEKDTLEGKIDAMDNGIELQLLQIRELLNKRYAGRMASFASTPVTFTASAVATNAAEYYAPLTQVPLASTPEAMAFEKQPINPQTDGLKPRVFISNSNTKVAEQVKRMLDFLHYDYVMGDKEETAVPISDAKFGLMKGCDCAIINIAASEQERRYSGLYVLNANVNSEINAAYLKYNTQVVLLVERKIDLPPNLKGLKRIEYDIDDLSFNAAMDLEKALNDFRKIQ